MEAGVIWLTLVTFNKVLQKRVGLLLELAGVWAEWKGNAALCVHALYKLSKIFHEAKKYWNSALPQREMVKGDYEVGILMEDKTMTPSPFSKFSAEDGGLCPTNPD